MAALRRVLFGIVFAVSAVAGFWALNAGHGAWEATAITCTFFGLVLLVAEIPRLRKDDVPPSAFLESSAAVLLLGAAALITVLRLHSLSWLFVLAKYLFVPVAVAVLQLLWRLIVPSTDRPRPGDDATNEPIAFYDSRIDAENDVLWRTGKAFRR